MSKTSPIFSPPSTGALANAVVRQGATCIVGIGVSASGVTALQSFFSAMPKSTGLAFVVIQQLHRNRKSYLTELLSKSACLPVQQAQQDTYVEHDHIYVIPPNTLMKISHGVLQCPPQEAASPRLPIDYFLRSLGEDQRERAIAIILAGTGSDGREGLKSIEANGGIILVQDPDTAKFNSMPRKAIATGSATFILPVEKMPAVLIDYARHPYPTTGLADTGAPTDEMNFDAIYALIHARVGYNFEGYKPSTLARRIFRRMGLQRIIQIDEYVNWLEQHPDEIDLLFKELLICVTGFFRDPEAWEILAREVIAPLVARKADQEPIRVWVPACATGEESFTIAMLFLEALQHAEKHCPLQIFATDISASAMRTARLGVYPESIVEHIGAARLKRFFEPSTEDKQRYKVRQELRNAVIFGNHDLINDPPFLRLDLISCRNLLIYLEPKAQLKIISVFHFALQPNAYLFLGSAETVGFAGLQFKSLSKKWRIYQHLGMGTADIFRLPNGEQCIENSTTPSRPQPTRLIQASELAQQVLWEHFVPASVMINSQSKIVYFCGPIDQFLRRPRGAPTQDLFAQVPNDLRSRLRTALTLAINTGEPVVATVTRGTQGANLKSVKLTVTPIKTDGALGNVQLIVFEDQPQNEFSASVPPLESALLRQMEENLHATQDDLQQVIKHLEISNEELRASNEEVIAVNEELQSVNEELETSKEKLQSLNEELYTVNQQLENKLHELESANDDLNNLLASSDVATLCLNTEMCIKWFTPALTHIFKLVPSDLNRPISNFSEALSGRPLGAEARRVLTTLEPSFNELLSTQGRWYFRRIVPYRTEDNHIAGVVVTYTDITESKQVAEKEIQAKHEMAEALELRVLARTAQLRTLTLALSVTEERERRALAQDLHDDLGQVLALTSIKLAGIRKLNRSPKIKEQLAKVELLMSQANQSVRTLAFQLCPPVLYELGLVVGLQWLIEEMRNQYHLDVSLAADRHANSLDTTVCTILFRAIRELLINVAKHANVKTARIAVKHFDQHIEVIVTDDGVGFDPDVTRAKPSGFGILSIRERLFYIGGDSRIESMPGQGSRVLLTAPLTADIAMQSAEN